MGPTTRRAQAVWWWAMAATTVLGGVFSTAVWAYGTARKDDLRALERRVQVTETRYEDVVARLDWITRVLWEGRVSEPPPARKPAR